jgi:hypothetical protein
MKRKVSTEDLLDMLAEVGESSYDGKCRAVSDSSQIEADGEIWGVVSDHGNVELGYRGRNGHLYWLGGLV